MECGAVLITGDIAEAPSIFSSQAMGDVLIRIAQQNSSIHFLVLCGHTHSDARYQPLNNLVIEAGRAEYECPQVQNVLIV